MQILAAIICRRNCKQEAATQPKLVQPVADTHTSATKEVPVFLTNPFYRQRLAPINQTE